jgi:7-alpha-hydroxysteroid dehydrogenase
MALERLKLDGQVAIITGAGRGIGRGLAEAGATVVCAARTASEIEETASTVRQAGGKALTRTCDVSRKADLIDLVQFTEREAGRIDIVLNNAGAIHYGPFLEITEEDFHWHIDLNLTSAFLLSQAATPVMLKTGGGSIVNISSAVGRFGARGMMAYGAAKGGLENLTRGAAARLALRAQRGCKTVCCNPFFGIEPRTASGMGVHL